MAKVQLFVSQGFVSEGLSLLVCIKSRLLNFFAAKVPHSVGQKMVVFLRLKL